MTLTLRRINLIKEVKKKSHPAWVRGLKHEAAHLADPLHIVAPRVGAWIETLMPCPDTGAGPLSHPAWVRGLKLEKSNTNNPLGKVAPRVGAWIETLIAGSFVLRVLVAPRVGAWIETEYVKLGYIKNFVVAPLMGAWIETLLFGFERSD